MSESLKVWSKFSPKTKDGSVINLRIVDMPIDLYDQVLNAFVKYFVREEAVYKAAGIPDSEEAIEELLELILKRTQSDGYHIVICCLDNGDDQIKDIIGVSMMGLASKGDPDPQYNFKSEGMKKLLEIIRNLDAHYDEMKAFNLERCFIDRGLFVCPEYRGLGIAQELLKVRRMICKEYGIPINGAWMTSYGTQKAAERDGWETVFEIENEELERKHGVTFSREPPTAKFMVARIE